MTPRASSDCSPPADPSAPIRRPWKRNLAFIWLSQFFSMMGFSFAIPFAPLFIQELGVTDPLAISLWVTAHSVAAPLTLAIFSPIWGALADRYGRRMMLLRSYIGGTILLIMMARTSSVQMLIVLRLAQGVLTGTMTAAQTMVSTQTPAARSGTALGALSAAQHSGIMAGSFAGGMFAELFGYRTAFMLSALFLAAAFLLVMFGVREWFQPVRKIARSWRSRTARVRIQLRPAFPLLGLIMLLAFVIHVEKPWIPLLVQSIHGSQQGAAALSGFVFAASSIAAFLAGPLLGMLADRMSSARLAQACAIGSGLLMLPVALVGGFPSLLMLKFGASFFGGGMDPMMQVWLARKTSAAQRGLVFGWAATARSLGWLLAPLVGGLVATTLGVRPVFAVTGVFLLLMAPIIASVAGVGTVGKASQLH